jgi:hypothetical protein
MITLDKGYWAKLPYDRLSSKVALNCVSEPKFEDVPVVDGGGGGCFFVSGVL